MIGVLDGLAGSLEKFGVDTRWFLVIFGIIMGAFALTQLNVGSNAVFGIMFATAPIWLPFTTFYIFFEAWIEYVQEHFDMTQGRTTPEIKLPQEIFKSPEAMELILVHMHQTASPDNHIQTYIDGKHPPKYSLEIVSREGDVRFYINTPKKKFKNLIETHLYAQYPGIEVHELDVDYTAEIPWDLNRFSYFSFHFGTKNNDAYPIKTYIDYGLHTMPKEEEKIDPITSVLEMMGNLGPGEHKWIQIIIDANRKYGFKEGSLHAHEDWKKAAKAEIKKIIETAVKERGGPDAKGNTMMLLTDTEKDTIKAIERSLGKNAFNVRIRGMYIAKKESFNPGEQIGTLASAWRQYDDVNRNAIAVRWRTDFDWNWWQDPKDLRKNALKARELNEYKRRVYTQHSQADGPKVLTTEELATIFHFPGKVATTPSLARIPSKRSEPPANLPIG